jgi:hypothetical protein
MRYWPAMCSILMTGVRHSPGRRRSRTRAYSISGGGIDGIEGACAGSRVITGMDPGKRSATIEIINNGEKEFGVGRLCTDRAGYRRRRNGVGRHLAQRLIADGEPVVDVPAKLSTQVRFSPRAKAARQPRSGRTRSRGSRCAHHGSTEPLKPARG